MHHQGSIMSAGLTRMARSGWARSAGHMVVASACLVACGGGCNTLRDPNVPDPIRLMMEPETGGAYEFYRPSTYSAAKRWPLVILCHGSGLDGSANAEIRQWTRLAESQGFFVAAPRLVKSKGGWSRDPAARIQALRTHERLILATVRHLQGGHQISEDRVFIFGRGSGAAPALLTGLLNPAVFRAVAVVQPLIDPVDFGSLQGRIDPQQPVLVRYLPSDPLTGKVVVEARDWLLKNHGDIVDDRGGFRERVVDHVVRFFEHVVASRPWAHIRAYSPDAARPLEVRFEVKGSFVPTSYEWDFGDESSSLLSAPTHVYAEKGVYRVTVRMTPPSGKPIIRSVSITVGRE